MNQTCDSNKHLISTSMRRSRVTINGRHLLRKKENMREKNERENETKCKLTEGVNKVRKN